MKLKIPFKSEPRPALKGPEDRMTLRDHLAELRVRIVRSMLAIVLGVIIMMAFYDPILRFIKQPYTDLCQRRGTEFCTANLFALGPLDGFSTRISISLYGGIVIAFPVILWQIWRFVVPGLHAKEKRYAVPFIGSTIGPVPVRRVHRLLDPRLRAGVPHLLVGQRRAAGLPRRQVRESTTSILTAFEVLNVFSSTTCVIELSSNPVRNNLKTLRSLVRDTTCPLSIGDRSL